jgi:hypothetical protein
VVVVARFQSLLLFSTDGDVVVGVVHCAEIVVLIVVVLIIIC